MHANGSLQVNHWHAHSMGYNMNNTINDNYRERTYRMRQTESLTRDQQEGVV